MSMDERLYWLKVEAGRKPAPADAWQGSMTDENNPVLERHVREIARLPLHREAKQQADRLRLMHSCRRARHVTLADSHPATR